MCPKCGFPQPPSAACTQCGAALPEAPRPPSTTAPTPLVQVRREVDLGDGRRLVFTPEAIEVFGKAPNVFPPVRNALGSDRPGRVALSTVRRASFAQARAWPALGLCAVALIGGALVHDLVARVAALVILAAGCWFYVRSRTWLVRFEQTSGEPTVLVLGGGAPGSPGGVKAQSLWVDLREELKRRGVEV